MLWTCPRGPSGDTRYGTRSTPSLDLFPTARISVLSYLQDLFCSSGSIEKEKESQGKPKGVWCNWKLSGILLSRASGPGLLHG